MGALSLRDEDSGRFVGQLLGRKSPVVDFRAAERIDSQVDDVPVASEARMRSSDNNNRARALEPQATMELDDNDLETVSQESASQESVIRVSQRPTLKVNHPVLANVQRHTRIEFVEIAPKQMAIRGVRKASHLAFATAAALIALSATVVGARLASNGPVLFPSYLAATTIAKDLRIERRFVESAADDIGPDGIAENVDGVEALGASALTGMTARRTANGSHPAKGAGRATSTHAPSSASHAPHAAQPHAAHAPAAHAANAPNAKTATHARSAAHGANTGTPKK